MTTAAFDQFIQSLSGPLIFFVIASVFFFFVGLIFFLKLWQMTNDIAAIRVALQDALESRKVTNTDNEATRQTVGGPEGS